MSFPNPKKRRLYCYFTACGTRFGGPKPAWLAGGDTDDGHMPGTSLGLL